MVTRNRKFPSYHGYSRNAAKRDAEQLVAEDLYGTEPKNRLNGLDRGAEPHARSHVALDLEPAVKPRTGVDLTAVTQGETLPDRPAGKEPWWVRLGLAAFRWISWR